MRDVNTDNHSVLLLSLLEPKTETVCHAPLVAKIPNSVKNFNFI